MKKISTILTFLLSANLFSAVEILDRVAVIVDDGLIMESQIKQSLSDIIQRYDQQNIPKPPPETLKDQVIERLVIEELQLQMANRAGVRISDTELNEAVSRIATNNNMQLQEFITFIEDDGASYEELREQIKREMIIQRIQRGRVGSEIDITEKEFDAYLATDESLNALEPELLVKQILVKEISLAEKVISRINAGEDFSQLAKELSISSNSQNGGLMNWRKAEEMPKLFSDAVNFKEVGYVTDPLESGAGYHILKLEDKRGDFVQYRDQWSARHILSAYPHRGDYSYMQIIAIPYPSNVVTHPVEHRACTIFIPRRANRACSARVGSTGIHKSINTYPIRGDYGIYNI